MPGRDYRHNLYGAGGACACATAAYGAAGIFDAEVGFDTGFAYRCAMFLAGGERCESTGGAHLCAGYAVVSACAEVEIEHRVQSIADAEPVGGRANDAVGACCGAESASGTPGAEAVVGGSRGAYVVERRGDRQWMPCGDGGHRGKCDSSHELAAAEGIDAWGVAVGRAECGGFGFDGLQHWYLQAVPAAAQGYGLVGTCCGAVEAHDTSRRVDCVCRWVDALGFASCGAESAAGALVGVDVDMI